MSIAPSDVVSLVCAGGLRAPGPRPRGPLDPPPRGAMLAALLVVGLTLVRLVGHHLVDDAGGLRPPGPRPRGPRGPLDPPPRGATVSLTCAGGLRPPGPRPRGPRGPLDPPPRGAKAGRLRAAHGSAARQPAMAPLWKPPAIEGATRCSLWAMRWRAAKGWASVGGTARVGGAGGHEAEGRGRGLGCRRPKACSGSCRCCTVVINRLIGAVQVVHKGDRPVDRGAAGAAQR
jgi:hypothetical protein